MTREVPLPCMLSHIWKLKSISFSKHAFIRYFRTLLHVPHVSPKRQQYSHA
ncbi:hypothetical protein Hanom_Chr11g00978631 [Helianthus anomalus]